MQENNQDTFNGGLKDGEYNETPTPHVSPENPPPLNETPVAPCYVPVYIPVNVQTPQDAERRAIRKNALIIALSGIGITAISFLWGIAYYAVMSVLGYAPTEAYKIASDPFFLQALQISASILMFVLLFSVVFKIGGYKISGLVRLDAPKKDICLPLILIGIGFSSFANLAVSLAGSMFESFGIDYSVDYGQDPKGPLGFLLAFISTAIVPALVEEFACRGLVLGSLRKFGDSFAVIASSVIFGLIHGNFEQMPFAFLLGLILGFATVKSGSIWVSCIIHSLNNAVAVTVSYIPSKFSEAADIAYSVYLMLALVIAIIGVCMLTNRDKNVFSFEKSELCLTEKQKHKYLFTQPAMIVLIIICVIKSMEHFF